MDNSVIIFKTESVNTVDTTGAGDAFVGAFSYALASNLKISESNELVELIEVEDGHRLADSLHFIPLAVQRVLSR